MAQEWGNPDDKLGTRAETPEDKAFERGLEAFRQARVIMRLDNLATGDIYD